MRLLYSPPFLLLLGVLPAAAAYRLMDEARRPPLLIHGLRWFLGLVFAVSGLAKLIPGFPNIIGPPWLESRLAPYGLALFARFVALSEVAVGLLLLTRRFATLGAVALFPMLTGILVVTISLQWRGTPIVNAVLLLMNAALLAHDYPRLRWLVTVEAPSASPAPARPTRTDLLWLAALAGVLGLLGLLHPGSAGSATAVLPVAVLLALIVIEWRRA